MKNAFAIMLTSLVAAVVPVAAHAAAPAVAAPASATPAAPTGYTTTDTSVGDLLDDPAAKAVLTKYLPQMVSSPQIDMARGMTLRQMQPYAADMVTDDVLAKIDADLAKLPAKK
jgi:hypothetical protein